MWASIVASVLAIAGANAVIYKIYLKIHHPGKNIYFK
jgi:hypothetical protein